MLQKKAKTLNSKQLDLLLHSLTKTRHPLRNRMVFLLSFKQGMRAKEIASLKWSMVTDAQGNLLDHINLPNTASKGKTSGRMIPLAKQTLETLMQLHQARSTKGSQLQIKSSTSDFVITTERSPSTSPTAIVNLMKTIFIQNNLDGCSSHSGRRTAITNWARKITEAGGSLKDVQQLAGHSALSQTQGYIDQSPAAQRKLISLLS